MSKVFSWLKQYSEKYAKQPDMEAIYREMAKETGLYIEQTVSGIRVLETLQLIEIEKSDSIDIKIIEHTEKKRFKRCCCICGLAETEIKTYGRPT